MIFEHQQRRFALATWIGVTLWLLAIESPSYGQDVCALTTVQDQNKELMSGAAEIAKAYKYSPKPQSLSGGPCNWTCGRASVTTPFAKAFGYLLYNCGSTTAPPNIRLKTGPGTNSQMGLSITDDDYRKEADKIFGGDLMRVPTQLVDASKGGKVTKLTDAVDAIAGATWMKFSSTSVDNDGQGADRVIIRVPDAKRPSRFEQWIQIAINQSTGELGRNVDFIGVQRLSDTPSPTNLTPPVVVFRGFSRTGTGFELEGRGSGSMLSKCYACHASGLRPVIPAKPGSKAAGGTQAIVPVGTMLVGADLNSQLQHLEEITSVLAVFGPKGYRPEDNGPPMGPESWSSREALVTKGLATTPSGVACAAGLKPARQQAIANKMNCATCHNGTERGVLNAATSLATIRHKVVENREAPMPPGVTDPDLDIGLTAKEREVLFECLNAEYREILQRWLTSDRLMAPGE